MQGMTDTILSAGAIGTLSVSKNTVAGSAQNKSLILAGYDIGGDLAFGSSDDGGFTSAAATGNIGTITVGGTMSGTSIAANIGAGADGKFGSGSGTVVSTTLKGAIPGLR